jgi:LPXTG-site transpeptidase (sortase) family protein
MPVDSKQVYIKDESFDPIYKSVNRGFFFKSKLLSGMLMALGFLILGTQVILPLVFFKTQDQISKPVESSILGIASGFSEFSFNELDHDDNTAANNAAPKFFRITIPKLSIKDAIVETNSVNLSPDASLGHYKGSALPGDRGNIFIYGHSVLPWFFNPRNYKTIFSTLGNLSTGDTITINYNNKDYIYKVESKEELIPNNVNPLEEFKPKYLNESTLELMTCWPAGTKAKRLIVRAVLVD